MNTKVIPFYKVFAGGKNETLKAKIAETFKDRNEFAGKVGIQMEMIECVIRGLVLLEDEDRQKWASVLDSTEQKLFGS